MTIVPGANAKDTILRAATVDSNGNCVFTFPTGILGQVISGMVTVYDSLPGILWFVNINGTPIDTTFGSATVGPVQIQGNEVLTISASGLSNNSGTTFHAALVQVSGLDTQVPYILPSADSGSLIQAAGQLLYNQTPHIGVGQTINFNPPGTSPPSPINVEGFASAIVTMAPGGGVGGIQYTISQSVFLNPAAYNFGSTAVGPATVPIALAGPGLLINATQTGGAAGTAGLTVVGINPGINPLSLLPPQTVISVQNLSLGSSGVSSVFTPTVPIAGASALTGFSAGRYRIWAVATGTSVLFRFSRANDANGLDIFFQMFITTANVDFRDEFVFPGDGWQLQIFNQGSGTATIDCTVTGPYS